MPHTFTDRHLVGCWDLEASELLIRESWRRRDAGEENWLPHEVVQDDPSLNILIVEFIHTHGQEGRELGVHGMDWRIGWGALLGDRCLLLEVEEVADSVVAMRSPLHWRRLDFGDGLRSVRRRRDLDCLKV